MEYAVIKTEKRKIFKNIKVERILNETTITLPDFKVKRSRRYGKKLCRVLKKYRVSNVVLEEKLFQNIEVKNILYQSNNYIIDGNRLYKSIVCLAIKDICKIMKMDYKEQTISILTNEFSLENVDLIEVLSNEVKKINIVTENLIRFEKFAEYLEGKNGAALRVCSPQKTNLTKSTFVINLDFEEEKVNKIHISKECIIFSIHEKISRLRRNFNGIIINDIDIWFDNKERGENFRTLSLCEAYIYNYLKKIRENERKFQKSGYKINAYLGENGKIEYEKFEKIREALSTLRNGRTLKNNS